MSTTRKIDIEKKALLDALQKPSINFNLEDTIPKPWMLSSKSANNVRRYGSNIVLYYNYRTGKFYVYNKDLRVLLLHTSSRASKTRSKRKTGVKTSNNTR